MDRACEISRRALMIASTRRMALHDFMLIVFSVVVIALSITPNGDERQTVAVRDAGGDLQRYSLAVEDPRLAKLQSDLAQWVRGVPEASLTLAKWHAELADFYIGKILAEPVQQVELMKTEPTAPAAGPEASVSQHVSPEASGYGPQKNVVPSAHQPTVAQVSFADAASPPASGDALSAEHAYWVGVRDAARKTIAEAEAKQRRRDSSSALPPIVFGELIRSGPSLTDFGIAGASGFGIAIIFACWVHVCPPITLDEDARSRQLATADSDGDGLPRGLRLSIPPQWVRIHQPTAVVLRRFTYAALVMGALGCCVFFV